MHQLERLLPRISVRRRAVFAVVAGSLVIAGCGFGGGDSGGGAGFGGNSPLRERHRVEVIECVHAAGFEDFQGEYSEAQLVADAPVIDALETCDLEISARPEFSELQHEVGNSVEDYAKRVAEAWATWKCVEEAGYTRTTSIPLTTPGGRPIRPSTRNFNVNDSGPESEAFYSTAASCGNHDIDWYMIDGQLPGPDTIFACDETNIGTPGYDNITGCFNVDEYPTNP